MDQKILDELYKSKNECDRLNEKYDEDFSRYVLISCGGGIIALIPYSILQNTNHSILMIVLSLLVIGATNLIMRFFMSKGAKKYSDNYVNVLTNILNDESWYTEKKAWDIITNNRYEKLTNILETIVFLEIIAFIIYVIVIIFLK